MNLMTMLLAENFECKNTKLARRIESLKNKIKIKKIKFSEKSTKLGKIHYYQNSLPYITENRDVLVKPNCVYNIRVNWNKKTFKDMSTDEIFAKLKPQWAWNFATVDAEHTRNKFKNKNEFCVVFDNKDTAEKYMHLFNSMFYTAIEQDAVEEYKKFKENPEKRLLTFDKLVENAYELYEAVDNDEL